MSKLRANTKSDTNRNGIPLIELDSGFFLRWPPSRSPPLANHDCVPLSIDWHRQMEMKRCVLIETEKGKEKTTTKTNVIYNTNYF